MLGNKYYGGSGPIWLDDLHCIGTEAQLGNCRHNGWETHNCRHYEDVSIVCSNESLPRGLNIAYLLLIYIQ